MAESMEDNSIECNSIGTPNVNATPLNNQQFRLLQRLRKES